MKEKIQITLKNLDDIHNVLKNIELLFQKLMFYYADKDIEKLHTLIVSISVWFGNILRALGYDNESEIK